MALSAVVSSREPQFAYVSQFDVLQGPFVTLPLYSDNDFIIAQHYVGDKSGLLKPAFPLNSVIRVDKGPDNSLWADVVVVKAGVTVRVQIPEKCFVSISAYKIFEQQYQVRNQQDAIRFPIRQRQRRYFLAKIGFPNDMHDKHNIRVSSPVQPAQTSYMLFRNPYLNPLVIVTRNGEADFSLREITGRELNGVGIHPQILGLHDMDLANIVTPVQFQFLVNHFHPPPPPQQPQQPQNHQANLPQQPLVEDQNEPQNHSPNPQEIVGAQIQEIENNPPNISPNPQAHAPQQPNPPMVTPAQVFLHQRFHLQFDQLTLIMHTNPVFYHQLAVAANAICAPFLQQQQQDPPN